MEIYNRKTCNHKQKKNRKPNFVWEIIKNLPPRRPLFKRVDKQTLSKRGRKYKLLTETSYVIKTYHHKTKQKRESWNFYKRVRDIPKVTVQTTVYLTSRKYPINEENRTMETLGKKQELKLLKLIIRFSRRNLIRIHPT